MEEVIPFLSQNGGDISHAAASYLFTANPGRVRYQNSTRLNRLTLLTWIEIQQVFVALQGRKHANVCRGASSTFHIFSN